MGAAAQTAQDNVTTFLGKVDIHSTADPNTPEPGVILDPQGQPVTREEGLIMRMDAKANEPITISKGLAWLIGVAIAIVPVGLVILVYMITMAMGYQTTLSRLDSVEGRMVKMEKAVEDINTLKLTTSSVQNDVKAIRDNQTARDADWKELIKNVSDLRIMAARMQLEKE